MSDLAELIQQSKVFGNLDTDTVQRLSQLCDPWEIHPGDILTNAGDKAYTFFLLASGTALLSMEDGKSVVLDTRGDFLGLELLSARGIYKTTLSILEKGLAYAISREEFLKIIQEDSVEAATIMENWQRYLNNVAPFAKNKEDISA